MLGPALQAYTSAQKSSSITSYLKAGGYASLEAGCAAQFGKECIRSLAASCPGRLRS